MTSDAWPDSGPRRRAAVALSAISCAALFAVTARSPQGVSFYDPVIQLLALQQHAHGVSPSWNVLVRPDPADLSRDVQEWIAWWPPSTALVTAPLLRLGLNMGASLRLVVQLSVLLGAIGWTRWWGRFPLPSAWVLAFACAVPWLRFGSTNLFRFSQEVFVFASAPWLFLMFAWLAAPERGGAVSRLEVWLGAGLVAGSVYWLKYSAIVPVIGLVAGVAAWWWWKGSAPGRPHRVARVAVLAAGCIASPLALRLWNASHAARDPLGASLRWDPMSLVFALSHPALAAADAFGPFTYGLVSPGRYPFGGWTMNGLGWVGLPGGLLMLGLLWRAGRRPDADRGAFLACASLTVTMAVISVFWIASNVDHFPRHFAAPAMAALPAVVAEGLRVYRAVGRAQRWALSAAAAVYVILPLVFGVPFVAGKMWAVRAVQPAASGLALPSLSAGTTSLVVSRLREHWTPDSVWVVEDPEMALELPGRSLPAFGGRSIEEDMRPHEPGAAVAAFRTNQPLTVLVVGHGDALPPVTARMGAAVSWERLAVDDAGLMVWRGRVPATVSAVP